MGGDGDREFQERRPTDNGMTMKKTFAIVHINDLHSSVIQ
jgi:hypothetical protein